MNFGMGKMRPLGHNHYHKYSHARGTNDLNQVCPDYLYDCDLNEEWYYDLENLRSGNLALRKAKKFDKTLPKCTGMVHMFSASPTIEYLKVYAPICKAANAMGIQQTKCITKIGILPEATTVANWDQQKNTYGTKHVVKLYAPKAIYWNSAFASDMNKPGYPDVFEIICDGMENGTNLFGAWSAQQNRFESRLDEDGNYCMITGKPEASRKLTTFPKLKNSGTNMFGGASLDKDYAIAVLRDLPDWSNDSGTHNFQISIHPDWTYDKELNLELKKIDKTWESPIELDEEVITDKGWHITRWNETWDKWPQFYPWNSKWDHSGSFTKNEVLSPAFIERINLNDIVLPEGYQRCLFLEDNGTQTIDTGYISDNETGIYVIAKQIRYVNRSNPPMAAANLYYGENCCCMSAPEWNKNKSSYIWWNSINSYSSIAVPWTTNTKVYWSGHGSIYEGKTNWLNSRKTNVITSWEDTWEKDLTELTIAINTTIHIFPLFKIGKDHSYQKTGWNGRIYRAKISQGESIVHDYIPCLDTNGRPCLYDILGTGTTEENTYYNILDGEDFTYELAVSTTP